MKRFAYYSPQDFATASKALRAGAVAKGAGTDLLDLLKERVYEPDDVVNLLQAGGPLREGEISALTTPKLTVLCTR